MQEPPAREWLRFGEVTGMPLEAMEYLLNDLSSHGLRVWRVENGQWGWAWGEQTGQATGLGSAVLDALYWYFGLTSDQSVPK